MKFSFSKKVVAGVTGVVLLGGAGGAVAATQLSGGSGRQAYIDDVAKHLGVSPSALTSAMKAAATDRINAALAAGKITQAQANQLKQRINNGDGRPFFGHRFGGGLRAGAGAAASYLGIGAQTLRSDLASGKTLAQIASTTPGKSVAGLKAAVLKAEKTRLDRAVSDGAITSQQAATRLSALSSRIDSILNRKWSGGPGFAPGGQRFGPGGPRFGPAGSGLGPDSSGGGAGMAPLS